MGMILVRATINLPGLKAGYQAKVDPEKPYVARCLHAEFLIPVDPWEKYGEANTSAVSLHRGVQPEGEQVEGSDGNSAEESDESDGPDAMDEV